MKNIFNHSILPRPQTIVFTGGPGVGKTSIIKHLQKLQYPVRKEVFTHVFEETQNKGYLNEIFLNSPYLIHELVSTQLELENHPIKGHVLFLDRSLIDIWGYVKNMKITPFKEDQTHLESADYDLIFVIEPIPERFYDQNSIRRQSYQESLKHHRMITENYKNFLLQKGKNPSSCLWNVPYFEIDIHSSINKRAQFILEKIGIQTNDSII